MWHRGRDGQAFLAPPRRAPRRRPPWKAVLPSLLVRASRRRTSLTLLRDEYIVSRAKKDMPLGLHPDTRKNELPRIHLPRLYESPRTRASRLSMRRIMAAYTNASPLAHRNLSLSLLILLFWSIQEKVRSTTHLRGNT